MEATSTVAADALGTAARRASGERSALAENVARMATATNARTKSLLFGFMTTEKAEYVRSLCLHSTDGEAISVCFFLLLFDVI